MSINTTDLSKLREEIERLSRENANLKRERNKFGLKYKTYPEEGDAQRILNNEIPFLNFNPEFSTLKENKTEADTPHVLIEGDNLPVLMSLQATHRGKVDVIYIDPPYNTGNKDFVYNDSFLSNDDGFRHSKWLSFMKPRLVLAKELLSETGAIFVSIDDNEQAPLKLLMDEVFGGRNFIANLAVSYNPHGRSITKFFANNHEYILVYTKDILNAKLEPKVRSLVNESQYPYKDGYGQYREGAILNTSKRFTPENRPNLYYPYYVDPDTLKVSVERSSERESEVFPTFSDGTPGVWRWGKTKSNYENHKLVGKRRPDGSMFVVRKDYLTEDKKIAIKTHLDYSLLGSNHSANKHIASLLGDGNFDYPKPVDTPKLIGQMIDNPNAIILDFFAGSGTTAHAVAELNKEDGGNRQCILVTHGEEKGKNIAQAVTAERMKRALTGENWADGKERDPLPGELYYYQLDYREDQDSMSGRDFVSAVALAENAHAIVEQDVDDSVVILDGKEHLVGVWTDYRLLDPYYEDELEDGTAMSEYRIQRMNEWAESQEKRIVWYVDTDPIFSETISHEDLLEEGKMCSGVSLLRDPYMNKVTNVMNRLKNVLARVEEEDTEDY